MGLLRFAPRLVDKIWGGRRLEATFGRDLPADTPIGESWEISGLREASTSVAAGPLMGAGLYRLAATHGDEIFGGPLVEECRRDFPLLVKFIDAHQDLSIQVHPDDAYAHRVEAESGFHGKNEAWYILDAKPGAELFDHLARPVTRAKFKTAVQTNKLLPFLNRRPVKTGDVIFVPAGTLHTIGAGVMLFEIQQKSDLTYRVYDYGRPRPLHLEKALDVIAFDRPPLPTIRPLQLTADSHGEQLLLMACQHFAMERWQLEKKSCATTRSSSLEIVTLTAGMGELSWDGGEIEIKKGESIILPATLGCYQLTPENEIVLLRCYIPDLERDLRVPLRRRGYSEARIANVLF